MRYDHICHQMPSDTIRFYQMLIRYHHYTHPHLISENTFIPSSIRLPIVFFFKGTMMFTHRNPEALGGGEFFGRVAFRIIHKGQRPRQERQELPAVTRDIHGHHLISLIFWWFVYTTSFLEDCTKLYQHVLMLMLFDVIYMVKIV